MVVARVRAPGFGLEEVVHARDFFGDAVNRASRLGEDIADPGEILVDTRLKDRLVNVRQKLITRDTPKGPIEALSVQY